MNNLPAWLIDEMEKQIDDGYDAQQELRLPLYLPIDDEQTIRQARKEDEDKPSRVIVIDL